MPLVRAASLSDVPVGASKAVEVDGVPVALVRLDESTVKAIHNICSHQYYELAPEGWVGDNSIECALHGSVFDLDTGAPRTLPALDAIPVYHCALDHEQIFVDVAAQRNDANAPEH